MGLLSDGGVHSHQDHLIAMAELASRRGAEKIYLHAFLDGRDTPPKSATSSIKLLDSTFQALGNGRIASIVARYYAMDPDNRRSEAHTSEPQSPMRNSSAVFS